MVEGRDGCTGEEARLAVVDDMQLLDLVVAILSADEARKEEVVWSVAVSLCPHPNVRWGLLCMKVMLTSTIVGTTKARQPLLGRAISGTGSQRGHVVTVPVDDLELDDRRRVDRSSIS